MNDFDPIAYINEPRWQESRLGLERTRDLLDRMGRPQDRLKFVHVAGTNGKGSTCAYIASILQVTDTDPDVVEYLARILLLESEYLEEGGESARAELRSQQAHAIARGYGIPLSVEQLSEEEFEELFARTEDRGM